MSRTARAPWLFPISVVETAAAVSAFGAAAVFPLAAGLTAVALLFGLSQVPFRQFGVGVA